MKYPLKNLKLEYYPKGDMTQGFGENPALYSQFGMKGHNGIDYVRPWGEQMYAVEDGTVLEVNNIPTGYGKHVRILSNSPDKDGWYHEWTYGHCSSISVVPGEIVYAGEPIAKMGNTGFVVSGSTPYWKNNPYAGTHLHFGLRRMHIVPNGWKYPKSNIGLQEENYGNGFKGSIDPLPYLRAAVDVVAPATSVIEQKQLTLISLLNQLKGLINKK